MKRRANYTKEFKLEPLRLMRESERPVCEIARELGVRRNRLYKWRETIGTSLINSPIAEPKLAVV